MTAYAELERRTAQLLAFGQSGQWEDAARMAHEIQTLRLPPARAGDRPAILAALAHLEELSGIAGPMRDQIGSLLAGLSAGSDRSKS